MHTHDLTQCTPQELRALARVGQWTTHSAGLAVGYTQANLVVLPGADAADFAQFCARNPRPCPVLEMTAPGAAEPTRVAPGADLRSDLPRYRVYEHGELVDEPCDIRDRWRDDFVGFLLGCSYTFEHALARAGVPLRHVAAGTNVPMYRTNRACAPAGRFHGPLVVSMRPIPAAQVALVTDVSGRYPRVHGAPVHAGDPAALGIRDLDQPDWGDPVVCQPGDVPLFWACGVTPQAVALASRPALMLTHAPGHMFITDIPIDTLAGAAL
jgi:uncharacterized protein YcsI (UPF0317 family)